MRAQLRFSNQPNRAGINWSQGTIEHVEWLDCSSLPVVYIRFDNTPELRHRISCAWGPHGTARILDPYGAGFLSTIESRDALRRFSGRRVR